MKFVVRIGIAPLFSLHRSDSLFQKITFFCALKTLKNCTQIRKKHTLLLRLSPQVLCGNACTWAHDVYVPKCMTCHKAIMVITGGAYCFPDYIYMYLFYIYIYPHIYTLFPYIYTWTCIYTYKYINNICIYKIYVCMIYIYMCVCVYIVFNRYNESIYVVCEYDLEKTFFYCE